VRIRFENIRYSIPSIANKTCVLYELQQTAAPDFWWDLTLDHNAPISTVVIVPLASEGRTEPETGFISEWDLEWAEGLTRSWSAGGSAYWVAWTWESKTDSGKLRSVFTCFFWERVK